MTSIVDALDQIKTSNVPDVGPGTFQIFDATIHHGAGAEYPIGQLIREIQLFEDIESVGVTGWVHVHDNVNLFQGGPLIGHELLYLKFETGGATHAGVPEFAVDYTKHPLFIFKVENMIPGTTDAGSTDWLDYRIHFCSTEMLRNSRIKLSRTHQGTISDIVKDIMTYDIKTRKPIEIEDTLDIYHFISPGFRPYDIIRELTAKAQMLPEQRGGKGKGSRQTSKSTLFKGRQSDFVFYETATRMDDSGGFKLMPAMMKADFPSLTFTLQTANTTTGISDMGGGGGPYFGYTALMLRSLNYDYTYLGDKYDTLKSGVWAGKHIRHNSVTKKFDIYKSDYQEQLLHKRYSHISDTPTFNSQRMVSEFPDTSIKFSSGSTQNLSNINASTHRADYPWSISTPSSTLIRTMQMMHLFGMHRLEFTLPGISGLSVGQLAFADVPNLGAAAGQLGMHGSKELWENRLDNVWLVTKVSHKLTTGGESPQYLTKVEIANTMSSTARVLPVYGSLGGRASGESSNMQAITT